MLQAALSDVTFDLHELMDRDFTRTTLRGGLTTRRLVSGRRLVLLRGRGLIAAIVIGRLATHHSTRLTSTRRIERDLRARDLTQSLIQFGMLLLHLTSELFYLFMLSL